MAGAVGTGARGVPTEEGVHLTWASPLPPTRSGVADYAAEVLPHLACRARLTLVAPPGWQPPPGDGGWLCLPRTNSEDPPPAGGISLLHLGNNPYHLWVAARLRRWGGVVVLHDPVLHHLLVEEAAATGEWERFAAELEAAYPGRGRALAVARHWGFTSPLDPFLFPACHALLRFARGAIVHSRWAAAMVEAAMPGLPVARVPLAVECLAQPTGRQAWRQRLGVGGEELVLLHLGFLTPAKGMDVILRALAALHLLRVPCRLVVVGEGGEGEPLRARVRAGGLEELVTIWGFAAAEELGGLLAAADLGLVPRYPTAGETSAAALRFLAAGVPVVVSGYRQFLEFPPAAALRIPPGEAGVAELVRQVAYLAGSHEGRERARQAARAAWREGGHEPAHAAAALLEAVASLDRFGALHGGVS